MSSISTPAISKAITPKTKAIVFATPATRPVPCPARDVLEAMAKIAIDARSLGDRR